MGSLNGHHGGDEGLNAPVQWAKGLWFAQLWTRYGARRGGSLRGFYYRLIREGRVTSYEYLSEAATLALSLGLVDAEAFDKPEDEHRWEI
jgi:hypothetical protein